MENLFKVLVTGIKRSNKRRFQFLHFTYILVNIAVPESIQAPIVKRYVNFLQEKFTNNKNDEFHDSHEVLTLLDDGTKNACKDLTNDYVSNIKTYEKLCFHLEKRVNEQEELISLLKDKINNIQKVSDVESSSSDSASSAPTTDNHSVGNQNKNKLTYTQTVLTKRTLLNDRSTLSASTNTNQSRSSDNSSKDDVQVARQRTCSEHQENRVQNSNKTKTRDRAVFGTADNLSQLTAVKRKLWLYVGRITPNTGVRGMEQHLKTIFPNTQFAVELLPKWKNSQTEAFKIGLDYTLQEELFRGHNWPSGALVKKYKFFRNESQNSTE
nr:unnamed protein product [Callosobruchus analis]